MQSGFFRNVAKVAGGNAGAQLLAFLCIPLITRLYEPEAFGELGIFMAVIAVLMPISALTYPIAIVLPKRNKVAIQLICICWIVTTILSILVLAITFLYEKQIYSLLGLTPSSGLVYLFPLAMFLNAFLQIGQQLLIRNQEYSRLGLSTFLQAVFTNLSKISLALLYPSGFSLALVTVLGYAIGATLSMRSLVNKYVLAFRVLTKSKFSETIFKTAKEYSDFPYFRAPQSFINSLSQSVPVVLLASYFGPSTVGFFSLCMSVLSAPIILIGKSINDVFYAKASNMFNNNDSIRTFVEKTTVFLFFISFPLVVFVFFFGEYLFSIVFGSKWAVAGAYASWMVIWLSMFLITRPVISLISILNLQKWFLKNEIVCMFIRILSVLLPCYLSFEDFHVIAIYSIVNFVIYMYLLFVVRSRLIHIENEKNVK